MKKLLKFLKYIAITLISIVGLSLVAIYIGHKYIFKLESSDKPTLVDIKSDGFCFGVGCTSQPKSIDAYVDLLAKQIKIYNTVAPSLWPNNLIINQYALVEDYRNNKSWLISPNGKLEELTQVEIDKILPNRPKYNVGFKPFKNNKIEGVYLALTEDDFKNFESFQEYYHLGTYDLFITYSHELFHILNQDSDPNWKSPKKIVNSERDSRFHDLEARTKRNLLYKQVLEAVSTEDTIEKRKKILDVIATFNDYKKKYKIDYESSLFFDREEGTAFYYELISSLYVGYPNQVNSPQSLDKALIVLAKGLDRYKDVGLGTESYSIGGWTGILLDQLFSENKNEWKQIIISDPEKIPLQILADKFINQKLPEPQEITQLEKDKIETIIKSKTEKGNLPEIFRFLYEFIF